jgi:hypothetical protein
MILTSASIIALMLGRLHMSASECIDAYLEMSEKVFGQSQGFTHREKFNPEALERVVKDIGQAQNRRGEHAAHRSNLLQDAS